MRQQLVRQLSEISQLATCNPFSPRRFQLEKKILGRRCEPFDSVAWNRRRENREEERPNVIQLTQRAAKVVAAFREQQLLPEELVRDYWNAGTYLLLYRHITDLRISDIWDSSKQGQVALAGIWDRFWHDYREMFAGVGAFQISKPAAAHLFACLAQIHRAFFNIFDSILGESLPITRLREKVWESIFTCCVNRYHDSMFSCMRDLSTLITGPSGTGKELVARAIGLSQYIPFDHERCRFEFQPESIFLPLNLSALSPTLIESELFGHRKGAFTGAVTDRIGWLESCDSHGAVFLDEIGELDVGLQVKLLRVLQQRTYCRLGESKERRFTGKIIAATNRDLRREITERKFREDFYFRLCSDRIETPSLQEQLKDRPADLQWLVESIVDRQFQQPETELANEICGHVADKLGLDYPWPGNIRELEQCVRSYIVRQCYDPMDFQHKEDPVELPAWLGDAIRGEYSMEQLLQKYCTWVYFREGSYEKASQVLAIDRRTVKSRIDQQLLVELKSQSQR